MRRGPVTSTTTSRESDAEGKVKPSRAVSGALTSLCAGKTATVQALCELTLEASFHGKTVFIGKDR